MAVLLARTADRLYWGARYLERAEDTARIVRAFNDLIVDYTHTERLSWEPLMALAGSESRSAAAVGAPGSHVDQPLGELAVHEYVLADRTNPSSIASSVASARENLRTTREVMPREAWQAINQLSQFVAASGVEAVRRQTRDYFLMRVIEISRRLDGVLESTMTRSNAYRMVRLGRLIERADMTTRVLGLAAGSALLDEVDHDGEVVIDDVRWMSVLRSVSALQMYQQAVSGPIDGAAVVGFLTSYAAFPRSVQGCFDELRSVLLGLPNSQQVLLILDEAEGVLRQSEPGQTDGHSLDRAMEDVQTAIAKLAAAVHHTYVGSAL